MYKVCLEQNLSTVLMRTLRVNGFLWISSSYKKYIHKYNIWNSQLSIVATPRKTKTVLNLNNDWQSFSWIKSEQNTTFWEQLQNPTSDGAYVMRSDDSANPLMMELSMTAGHSPLSNACPSLCEFGNSPRLLSAKESACNSSTEWPNRIRLPFGERARADRN